MKFSNFLIVGAILFFAGCASIHDSSPPKVASVGAESISFSADMPKSDFLPDQSVNPVGTKYVVVQAEGGNILLGPILGSMNISANTKAMAEQYKDSLIGIDPTPIADEAMERSGIRNNSTNSRYIVKPFVFVQHCYDDKFRLSLVFHVESTAPANPWIGRYTYHLPTSYLASQFGHQSVDQQEKYKSELREGSAILTSLMQRDVAGDLPAKGKKINFGTLYIIGNKMGGMGIYTMPEQLFFRDAELIEETDTYVTVRLKGNMHMTGVFGGMAFGVHRIDKDLVHTLKPVTAS